MRSFKRFISEDGGANTTSMFGYGFDFAVDEIPSDFDVGDYDRTDDRDGERLKHRWELENALYAETRRELVLKWLKAAGANSKQAVSNTSLPKVPKWQTAKR